MDSEKEKTEWKRECVATDPGWSCTAPTVHFWSFCSECSRGRDPRQPWSRYCGIPAWPKLTRNNQQLSPACFKNSQVSKSHKFPSNHFNKLLQTLFFKSGLAHFGQVVNSAVMKIIFVYSCGPSVFSSYMDVRAVQRIILQMGFFVHVTLCST